MLTRFQATRFRQLAIGLGMAFFLAGCDRLDPSLEYEDYSFLGQPAPRFRMDGNEYPPQNDVVLLEFWGLWCADCIEDAPHTARVRQMFAAEPRVTFSAVHAGEYGRWGSIDAYFAETGDPFDTLDDPAYNVSTRYDVNWFPSYLLIDRNGTIVHVQTTLSRRDGERRLVEAIQALLEH